MTSTAIDIEACSALLREILDEGAPMFERDGRRLEAPVALRTISVGTDLLKLGLFALNIHSLARLNQDTPAVRALPLPGELLGLAFDFALETAPATDVDGRRCISVRDLARLTALIEASFGEIRVDPALAEELAVLTGRPDPSPGKEA